MQKLLTVILIFAVIYLLIKDDFKTSLQQNNKQIEQYDEKKHSDGQPIMEGNFIEKSIAKIVSNTLKTEDGKMFMENIVKPIDDKKSTLDFDLQANSDRYINQMFRVKTSGKGSGRPVSCGHLVMVKYKIMDMHNILISEKTKSFPLGRSGVPGLDAVATGMKVGQTRNAIISSKLFPETFHNKANRFKIEITLLKTFTTNMVNTDEIKIFDDVISRKAPMLCGSRAVYNVKIVRNSTGEVLYDSKVKGKKLDMTIGHLAYPIIFSHALHNKPPSGSRTVITPGKYLKSHATKFSYIFPDKTFKANEQFMIIFDEFKDLMQTQEVTIEAPSHLK